VIDHALFVLGLLSVLGCGLVSGIFFSFSTFVMKALARIPAAQGISAMQSINITVINPWFMVPFMGTAVACFIIMFSALTRWSDAGTAYLLSGSLTYLMGTFLVTIIFNVPLNNALESVEPESPDGERLWKNYVASWASWNHVRTIASGTASVLLLFAHLC